MKILAPDDHTLAVSGLQELVAANAAQVRDEIRAALKPTTTQLDLDLSGVTFLDSGGLGTLISLQKSLRARNGTVRLLNPSPNARQLLELTRLHSVFDILSQQRP